MTPDRHRQLMDLFDEVCDLAMEPRAARMEQLRSEDPPLAADLERMLSADAQGAILDDTLPRMALPETPQQLGRYRIVRVLGQGGFGVVYEAEQELPRRRVAVKVIRGHLATTAMRKRFEVETHILGRLNHPGVSRIYEAATEEDVCFFAMELVDGKPLTAWAEERRLDVPARLDLLARVCEAVHHAHLRGVIHLDLKPANILVQDDGQPKVLDFGIARVVESDTALSGMTLSGQIVGTPAYMSPEQTSLPASELDARSDIYTLGVIGYELLSRRLPHDARGVAIPDLILRIREQTPDPISRIRPDLRGDVETILGKAMAREPDARYQSAAALADDLRRYLRREPIAARPPSVAYQLVQLARRNRALVAALGALAAALVAGTIASLLLAARAERARAAAAARSDALTILEARASLLEDPTRSVARLKTLSPAAAWDDAMAVAREAERLGVARDVLAGHESEVHSVAFAAGGELLATASYDHTVRIWDLARRTVRIVRLDHEAHLVSFAPFGRTLLAAGNGGELLLIGSDVRKLAGHDGWVMAMAWAPNGLWLASGDSQGTVRVWRRDGSAAATLHAHDASLTKLAWSSDGARFCSAGEDGTVRVWTAGGIQLASFRGSAEVTDVAFAEDGLSVVLGGRDGQVDVLHPDGTVGSIGRAGKEIKHLAVAADGAVAWAGRDGLVHVARRRVERVLPGRVGVARAVVFSPDGSLLAAAGDDRTVHLWSMTTGDSVTLRGHAARVRELAFSPDGSVVASASDDGTVRLWPAQVPFGDQARRVATSSRGGLAVAGADGAIRLLGPSGERLLVGHTDEVYQLAFAPDGRRLASASRDQTVRVWDTESGAATALPGQARAVRVAFGTDHLAAGLSTGTISLWDLRTGAAIELAGHEDRVIDLAFSPDERQLASAGKDGTVHIWDLAAGADRVVARLPERATALTWSRDGSRLAVGSEDGSVRVWPTHGGSERLLGSHSGAVAALAWSSDGRTLASAGVDRVVRLWREGAPPLTLGGHGGAVVTLLFAADGASVVTGAADGAVRLFSPDGLVARVLARGRGPVLDMAPTSDGRVAFVSDDDGLRVIPITAPTAATAVRARLAALSDTRLDASDVLVAPGW